METDRSYFTPPELDRILGLLMQLAEELHVTRHRCLALEQLLVRHGILAPGEVDAFEPSEAESAALAELKDAMVARLLRIVTEDGPSAHPLRRETVTGAAK